MHSIPTYLVVAAIAVAAAGAPLQSQGPTAPSSPGSGVIRGRLADSASGAPIATGSITFRRGADTTIVAVARPKDDGSFRIEGLSSGAYTLNVRVLGFAPRRRAGI